jgi:hypothetical protein
MKNYLKQMMRDTEGNFSSKRFVTVGAFLLLSVAFLVDVFIDINLPEYVWDDMMYIVILGVGFTASERFSTKKPKENNDITSV